MYKHVLLAVRQRGDQRLPGPSEAAWIGCAAEGRGPTRILHHGRLERLPAGSVAAGLITILGELQARDIDLHLHQQALDSSTPSGRALFGMLGVFSEFERR